MSRFYFIPNKHFLAMAFCISVLISCNNAEEKTTAENITQTPAPSSNDKLVFDKLIGTWKMKDGKSYERWTKQPNGHYQSVAFTVSNADTSWNEQASIYPENGNWIFENTVKGQNNGKAIRFVSTQLDKSTVQFSNPAHDFPQQIHYSLPDENTISAFIAGTNVKGGIDTIPFNYTRLQ